MGKPIAVFLKSLLSFASPQDLCSVILLELWTKVPFGGGWLVLPREKEAAGLDKIEAYALSSFF